MDLEGIKRRLHDASGKGCFMHELEDHYITDIPALVSEVERLQPLAEFAEKVIEAMKEATAEGDYDSIGEIDGWMRDLCERGLGNIRRVKFDPAIHNEWPNSIDADPGDEIWYWGDERKSDAGS